MDVLGAARRLFSSRDFESARVLAERALHQDPNNGRMWELLGLIHHASGRPDAAQAALESASLFVPLMPAGGLALADCYHALGREELLLDVHARPEQQPRAEPRHAEADRRAGPKPQLGHLHREVLDAPGPVDGFRRGAQPADPPHARAVRAEVRAATDCGPAEVGAWN
ncbi:MAG: tetratricopeptide repeat protein [Planctomycetes bacterium]|nr:tetratricopeptide repeat protein [Planctomycetota bacterium]